MRLPTLKYKTAINGSSVNTPKYMLIVLLTARVIFIQSVYCSFRVIEKTFDRGEEITL